MTHIGYIKQIQSFTAKDSIRPSKRSTVVSIHTSLRRIEERQVAVTARVTEAQLQADLEVLRCLHIANLIHQNVVRIVIGRNTHKLVAATLAHSTVALAT